MKKILLIIAIIATTHSLFAQETKFTIQGGINLANIGPVAPLNGGGNWQARAKFQIGGLFDLNFKGFTLQPGFLLTGKGNVSQTTENLISNGSNVPYTMLHSVNITYAEVPVNMVFRQAVKPGNIYFGAGPYIARAVWGTYSNKSTISTYYKRDISNEASFGSGTDQFNAMDFGLNALAGFELKNGMRLGFNYGLGFSNITNDGNSSKNRVGSFVVGYQFK
ncbi:PorT family protein [Mucilaginibacter mali]|uniref:PorT family protein n=1 Tax=Mucilaginibacter mali TaxID=2740462 RepID=A0A7D4Q7T7_9SPHI|nr:outer membrane beta-barrel protein [Mucilaginibacter mali]QKJ30251.1 PorT family protein [Mucilaginibacter mali]